MITDIRPMNINDIFNRPGRYFLFNIKQGVERTAACINIRQPGSGRCRFSGSNKVIAVSADDPGFKLTSDAICMPTEMLNTLGNNFEAIRCNIPEDGFNENGRVAVGLLRRDSEAMGDLLNAINSCIRDIERIFDSLQTNINTPIYELRRNTRQSVVLASESRLTNAGESLLEAYSDSLSTYSSLPELCGFGNENAGRCRDEPSQRDAQLRFWMQRQSERGNENPLGSKYGFKFIAHELKPLNIQGRDMRWNCKGDPRTDSIDLLLSHEGSPVITEVKMAGDKFLSVAAIQLLYYSAVLASDSQRLRLARWFGEFNKEAKPWIGLLAQTRDETKGSENGFHADFDGVLQFLKNRKTRDVMRGRFAGAFVITIDESSKEFAVSPDGEYRIEWQE